MAYILFLLQHAGTGLRMGALLLARTLTRAQLSLAVGYRERELESNQFAGQREREREREFSRDLPKILIMNKYHHRFV
jgi:hypothetical protein